MDLYKKTALTALLLTPLLIPSGAAAEGLKLRTIMLDLAHDMEAIVRAISFEDYKTVKLLAKKIADHARPPLEERMRIMKFLKGDAAGFKAADDAVHTAAEKLAEAASKEDRYMVVENFRDVLNGCVDCHTKYRIKVRKEFYKDSDG